MFITVGYASTQGEELDKRRPTPLIYSPVESRDFLTDPLLPKDDNNLYPMIEEPYDLTPWRRNPITVEYPRMFFYEGEPLHLMCFGLKHFHSFGAQLRLSFGNGSESIVLQRQTVKQYAGSGQDHLVGLHDGFQLSAGYSPEMFVPFISSEVRASLDMKSVECFMPRSGNEDWDKLTYDLKVVPAVLPEFLEAEHETVYLEPGETNLTIKCTVTEGKPRPEVTIKKDGKPMDANLISENSGNNGTELKIELDTEAYQMTESDSVSITFSEVTHEIQGSYECVAENVKGRKKRKVMVVVGKKRSWTAVVTALGVLGGLLFILVLVWVKYRLQLREMWRARTGALVRNT